MAALPKKIKIKGDLGLFELYATVNNGCVSLIDYGDGKLEVARYMCVLPDNIIAFYYRDLGLFFRQEGNTCILTGTALLEEPPEVNLLRDENGHECELSKVKDPVSAKALFDLFWSINYHANAYHNTLYQEKSCAHAERVKHHFDEAMRIRKEIEILNERLVKLNKEIRMPEPDVWLGQ